MARGVTDSQSVADSMSCADWPDISSVWKSSAQTSLFDQRTHVAHASAQSISHIVSAFSNCGMGNGMMATLTPRTSSPTPSNASSFVDDASTRAIFDGTPGKKPRIEFIETLNAGLQPEFADYAPSDASSTRAIYHGSRPGLHSHSSNSSNPSSPLPRLAALRGMSYRDQRLELGGVNTHPQSSDITDWQNGTEDGGSATSEEVWMGKEDQTSVTESTVAEDMEEQKSEGTRETDEERRRKLLEKAKKGSV